MNHLKQFAPRHVVVEARMTKLIQSGRARFQGSTLLVRVGDHDLQIRPSFTSRAYRAAAEIVTRSISGLVSLEDTRAGKPYNVIIDCPSCGLASDFILETWSPATAYDPITAAGYCENCCMDVTLTRDHQLQWSADFVGTDYSVFDFAEEEGQS